MQRTQYARIKDFECQPHKTFCGMHSEKLTISNQSEKATANSDG